MIPPHCTRPGNAPAVDHDRPLVAGPVPRGDVPGIDWPLLLAGPAATMELLQAQFRVCERSPQESIADGQRRQIERLAAHAHARSPLWRARLDAAGYASAGHWFEALPVLTRRELQAAGDAALALPVPAGHGRVQRLKTSGSTGTPLDIAKTDLAMLFVQAAALRESMWHRRDLRGTLATIRVGATQSSRPRWSSAYRGYDCGPAHSFDAREDVDRQLDWLDEVQPHILLSHASNLRALALRSVERGRRLERLREVRSFSEAIAVDLRQRVREAWNVPVTDLYSANETGTVALQCPDSGLYHVQAEDVLVEIIDDSGRACSEGESGRVIVTSLHNFAMPFLRYDLGDYATVGPACPCGRTLPTIAQVLGRQRNMLRLPVGRVAFPGFPMDTLVALSVIREVRMIQRSLDLVEVELVLERPLTTTEASRLAEAVRQRLRHPFEVRLTAVAQIDRSEGHKREDFLCQVI